MTTLAGGGLAATACLVVLWSPLADVSAQAGAVPEGEGLGERTETNALHEEHEQHQQHQHGRLALGVDLVIGFGGYPLFGDYPLAPPAPPLILVDGGSVDVSSESLLVSGDYEITEHIGVGLRLPLTLGRVPTADNSLHSAFALGNLELEVETELELSKAATLVLSLGAALPTAQGSQTREFDGGELSSHDDGFMLNQIAASSRGFEDNALFAVGRLGIIPKVALNFRASHVLLAPFVKLENLIATRGVLERDYRGELVFGAFLGYELSEHFDLGTRVWATTAFLDQVHAVGVLEPQLHGHLAPVDFVLGVIIPFAGELTEPQFVGVRLGAIARL